MDTREEAFARGVAERAHEKIRQGLRDRLEGRAKPAPAFGGWGGGPFIRRPGEPCDDERYDSIKDGDWD